MRTDERHKLLVDKQTRIKSKKKSASEQPLTVLDLFCGAGGFSEGFRSVGFRIASGVDYWQPAIDTFNCNFELDGKALDILSLERNAQLIEQLPDTDVIIGSPPCVSFSYSNKLGNADKTEGLRLIKIFFSIVAIKKFKRGSKLLAWYMENVTNALKSLPDTYTFAELGLLQWATKQGLNPKRVAIEIKNNAVTLNAADFGVAQTRKRLFICEINRLRARRKGFAVSDGIELDRAQQPVPGRAVRSLLPPPTSHSSTRKITDPTNTQISIPLRKLTDHFYENGAYKIHWRDSRLLKISHPYMGKMAFPEDENKPSRTIVATPFPRSREALLYESEWERRGNGQYRGPTVREAACLMSFPITYQFVGREGAKWKLVGNAVCPHVSRALAVQLSRTLGLRVQRAERIQLPKAFAKVPNLNTFAPKQYDKPPKRKRLARFRSHPLKAAGMTVALANYDIKKRKAADGNWRCFVTYGIGEGYKVQHVDLGRLQEIRRAVEKHTGYGINFVEQITNGFSERIPSARMLQDLYERNMQKRKGRWGPNRLLEEIDKIIFKFTDRNERLDSRVGLFLRNSVPMSQLYALFAVGHVVSTTQKVKGD